MRYGSRLHGIIRATRPRRPATTDQDLPQRRPRVDGAQGRHVLACGRATCAIVGPSGSGKTTLLGLCAGLDRATSGSVRAGRAGAGQALDEDARARVRNEHTGFVFQNFQLVPTLTALENVMVPAELR